MTGAHHRTESEIAETVRRIKPLLAGRSPEVQGAILADCLAIWLAGHYVAADRDATMKLRAVLLAEHVRAVLRLTTVNAKIMGTTP